MVLTQEVSEYNRRLETISTSLSRVVATVKGEGSLMEEVEEVYQALSADTVPMAWQV